MEAEKLLTVRGNGWRSGGERKLKKTTAGTRFDWRRERRARAVCHRVTLDRGGALAGRAWVVLILISQSAVSWARPSLAPPLRPRPKSSNLLRAGPCLWIATRVCRQILLLDASQASSQRLPLAAKARGKRSCIRQPALHRSVARSFSSKLHKSASPPLSFPFSASPSLPCKLPIMKYTAALLAAVLAASNVAAHGSPDGPNGSPPGTPVGHSDQAPVPCC